MSTSGALIGGCQCGAARYHAVGELGYPHVCYCRMRQKAAGNYVMPLAAAQRSNVALTRGTPTWFHSSDAVRRGFCGTRGPPLIYDVPGTCFINIVFGSLDEPNRVTPVMQSSMAGKAIWFHELDGLPIEPDARTPIERMIAESNHRHPDHDTAHWQHGASS